MSWPEQWLRANERWWRSQEAVPVAWAHWRVAGGLGMGATMMPTVTGAMQTLRRESVARGTTTVNIIQQVGASVGTAVLSIVLVNAISDRLHVSGGLVAAASVPPQMRDRIPHLLTDAVGARFWWAVSLKTRHQHGESHSYLTARRPKAPPYGGSRSFRRPSRFSRRPAMWGRLSTPSPVAPS
jgi:hypothetical protein